MGTDKVQSPRANEPNISRKVATTGKPVMAKPLTQYAAVTSGESPVSG